MRWTFLIFILVLGLFLLSYFLLALALEEFYPSPAEVSKISLPENQLPHDKEIILVLVGDIMLDRGVEYMVDKYGNGDYKFPFLEIKPRFKEADILFGNLESVISDKGKMVGSEYSFRAKPEALEGLIYAGFDVISVANNHIFDYGREAMEDSFLRLKTAGINYVGGGFNEKEAYSPVIKEINGAKIAFLAYTNLGSSHWEAVGEKSGIAWLQKERMEQDIKEAKMQADLVIVSFHYGDEYKLEPNLFQVSISQAAVDAGADLVVGHHPHVIQTSELYKKSWIFYSLGNFIFDQGFSQETMKGQMLKVLIENAEIKEIVPINIKVNNFFQPEIK